MLMGILCMFGNILIAFFVILFSDAKKNSGDLVESNSTEDTHDPAPNGHNNHQTQHHDQNRLLPDGEVMAMYPLASTSLFHSLQQSIKKLFGVIGRGKFCQNKHPGRCKIFMICVMEV